MNNLINRNWFTGEATISLGLVVFNERENVSVDSAELPFGVEDFEKTDVCGMEDLFTGVVWLRSRPATLSSFVSGARVCLWNEAGGEPL